MVKMCQVCFVNQAIFILPYRKTEPGFWIGSEPFLRLDRDDSVEELGESVLSALDSSRESVAVPDDPQSIGKAIATFAGFKSWNAFAKRARCFLIEYDGKDVW